MPEPARGPGADGERITVHLPTGTLVLSGPLPGRIAQLCDFAARANPKRGFLIVSKVLGRHLPTPPEALRAAADALAAQIPALPGPVLFCGMAETATGLAQSVWAAWRLAHPGSASAYFQSSRQTVPGAAVLCRFEEGHSHAASHMVQVAGDIAALLGEVRSLVIIDDECSTGSTFLEAAGALTRALPQIGAIACASLTDWSGGAFIPRMPRPASSHCLIAGALEWTPGAGQAAASLAATANRHGTAPAAGMRSRTGLLAPEAATRAPVTARPGERITVLGDGEHAYEALLIAEEIAAQGGIAAIQSITRTPAMPGHAMQSVTTLGDAYGSGATCHVYNLLAHRPDRIVIAAEIAGGQADELRGWLAEAGSPVMVETLLCRYGGPA
ncbi:phosphoribosyltransferase domain-containing protein [Porphyrobacter sp. AAP82]|uniref:phosphoribosyltransferase domain-containing protein n=1 Tax=Porphyrobacter sp. AAP82 TaxID=1248917 RepID=UPI0002D77598|nr:phosphoribosyltransferase domain-containing protein [Porphyrobacter sp. AAP82]